jgi:hypothetical protein
MNTQELIDAIRLWGEQKGITGFDGKGTLLGQLSKTQEELTETRDAAVWLDIINDNDDDALGLWDDYRRDANIDLADGIGDCAVTLILAAEMAGLRFENCLHAAYDEIKGRTGKMVDGQFVKDEKNDFKERIFWPVA